MMILLVAVGGAVGAVSRYAISGWVHSIFETTFPLGTLVVNAVGSFGLGLLLSSLEASTVSPEVRSMLTIGFLGAFTTFSTFSYETVMLLETGEWGKSLLYMGGSIALGLIGVLGGIAIGTLAFRIRG